MTRATLAIISVFASIFATAETNRTATENWTRNRIAAATNGLATVSDVESKADKATTLEGYGITNAATKTEFDVHVAGITNPHKVTAEQVGALPLSGGTLTGDLAIGTEAKIELDTPSDDIGAGVNIGAGSSGGGWLYVAGGPYSGGFVNIGGSTVNGLGGTLTVIGGVDGGAVIEAVGYDASITKDGKEVATESYVDAKVENAVLPTNPSFSNAVLSVGLNIDTNSVAVLNEIAETFGGLPIEGAATTIGGLLAALAAAVAWLKKNKADKATTLSGYGITDAATEESLAPEYSPSSAYSVGAFVYHDGNIYQCTTAIADGGEAWNAAHWELRKLDDFFTESNSLLTGTIDSRLPYPLYAVPSTGILKDRAINTTSLASVTVPDNFTDLLIRASVSSSLSVTMPEAITTKYGDTFPGEAGEYLITITKTGAAEAYVRTIKLEEVA